MKTSDYMDKKVTALSRSRSDEFSDTHYTYDYEEQEPSSPTFSFCTSHHPHTSPFTSYMDQVGLEKLEEKKLRSSSFEEALISLIDRRMKDHNDKVLHAVDGVSAQISQLETRMHKLDNAIDGLNVTMGNNHGKVDGKLRELENVLRQVENYIRDLRDKQDIAETQMELLKLQLVKAESQEAKKKTTTQSKPGEETLSSAPQQIYQTPPYTSSTPPSNIPVIPQPPTQMPQKNAQTPQNTIPLGLQQQSSFQPPMVSSEIAHQQYHIPPVPGSQPAHLAFHSPGVATPLSLPFSPMPLIQYSQPLSSGFHTADGSQIQPQQIPHMESIPHSSSPPMSFHPPDAPRPQSLPASHMQPAPRFQGTDLSFQHPSGPMPQAQAIPQFPQMPKSRPPLEVTHLQSHYSYDNEFTRFPSQNYPQNSHNLSQVSPNVPPSQRFEPSLTKFHDHPPSRAYSDLPSSYSHLPVDSSYQNPFPHSTFNMDAAAANSSHASSLPIHGERSGYSNLPTAKVLPHALPTASFITSESSSDRQGESVPGEDVVDKVVAMGFRRDVVRATVKRLSDKGKSVDLNVVLDILMNEGHSQNQNNRTVR